MLSVLTGNPHVVDVCLLADTTGAKQGARQEITNSQKVHVGVSTGAAPRHAKAEYGAETGRPKHASKVAVVAVVRLLIVRVVESRLPPYIHLAPTTAAFYSEPHQFCDYSRPWMALRSWYVRTSTR